METPWKDFMTWHPTDVFLFSSMKTNSIGKPFTIEKILKIDFQIFHISWKAWKSISWTFHGSLHNETILKYVFHEMIWKKYFTLCPHLIRLSLLIQDFGLYVIIIQILYYKIFLAYVRLCFLRQHNTNSVLWDFPRNCKTVFTS